MQLKVWLREENKSYAETKTKAQDLMNIKLALKNLHQVYVILMGNLKRRMNKNYDYSIKILAESINLISNFIY